MTKSKANEDFFSDLFKDAQNAAKAAGFLKEGPLSEDPVLGPEPSVSLDPEKGLDYKEGLDPQQGLNKVSTKSRLSRDLIEKGRDIVETPEKVVTRSRPIYIKGRDHNNSRDLVETYKKVETPSKPKLLVQVSKYQRVVYKWFMDNGPHGQFNKGIVSADTGVNQLTVRNSVQRLRELKTIFLGKLDPRSKLVPFTLNPEVKVLFPEQKGMDLIEGRDLVTTYEKVSTKSRPTEQNGHNLNKGRDPSYIKLVSLFINKLTNFVKNSPYLPEANFTEAKFQEWIEKDGIDPARIYLQLQLAVLDPNFQKPKRSAIALFQTVLLSGGSFNVPPGFKSVDEIQAEELEKVKIASQHLEELVELKAVTSDPTFIESVLQPWRDTPGNPVHAIAIKAWDGEQRVTASLRHSLEIEYKKLLGGKVDNGQAKL